MQPRKLTSMANDHGPILLTPRRGEIWTASLGESRQRHWVLIVSIDPRNISDRAETALAVPFASRIAETPTTIVL
jgi:hypothetical protein